MNLVPGFPNLFTDKFVGVAFASAFALWAWMLNNLADGVKDGVANIQKEQTEIKSQISSLRSEISSDRVITTRDVSELRARQMDMLRRLDMLEDNGHEVERRLGNGTQSR